MSVPCARGASRLASLVLLGALVSCSGVLPNSASFDRQGERDYSALSAGTAIATLIRERGITDAGQLLARAAARAGAARSGEERSRRHVCRHHLRSERRQQPAEEWLVQSPTRWGHRADDLPLYPFDCKNCERDVMLPSCSSDADCPGGGTCGTIWAATAGAAGARSASATPMPWCCRCTTWSRGARRWSTSPRCSRSRTGASSRRCGRGSTSWRERPAGHGPPHHRPVSARQRRRGGVAVVATSELRDSPGARLTVSVAAMRSCIAFEDCKSYSWPHAKFIAIDGREALVGGHNLWSADYLVDNPVHDLSMLVHGPAATSPSRFADRLWQYVCANLDKKPSMQLASFSSGQTMAVRHLAASLAPPGAPREATGGVPILAVGRLGAGITKDFANQSELARDLMLGAARHEIRHRAAGYRLQDRPRRRALPREHDRSAGRLPAPARRPHLYRAVQHRLERQERQHLFQRRHACGPSRAICAT